MADVEFERRLERLFDGQPEMADGDRFAEEVERRLDRGWNLRRWLIGSAGVAGGLIGVTQLLMSNVVARIAAAPDESAMVLSMGVRKMAPSVDHLSALPSGAGLVWIAAALAVVALGFALTRVIGEL